MRVILITRPDLEDTNRLLRRAAGLRGLCLTVVVPGEAAGKAVSERGPRLIYRAATDAPARACEKRLARPGDALLYDPHLVCASPRATLARAGLPMARAVYTPSREQEVLAKQVESLGGWPIVVKTVGQECSRNAHLAQNLDTLVTVLESSAHDAVMEAYVPQRCCWRLTVLGDRVLAASVSEAGTGAIDLDPRTPPGGAAEIAIAAAHTLRFEFGEADIMGGPDGTLTLAEFRFPCDFARQQRSCRVDIAGHLIEHLAGKVS